MTFEEFSTRYGVFLCISGHNPLTKKLVAYKQAASEVRREYIWRRAAVELLSNMGLFACLLDMIEKTESAKGVDLKKGLQLGRSRIFMSAAVFEFIEGLYVRAITFVARQLQTKWRMKQLKLPPHALFFANNRRSFCRYQIIPRVIIQRQARIYVQRTASTRIQKIARGRKARQLYARMKRAKVCFIRHEG
jgi:hypothetical protein